MSEVRVCVRDHRGDYWMNMHGSDGDRLIAACSHTPRTLDELCAACEHYAKGATKWVQYFERGRLFLRHGSGLVIIDLTARLIAIDSGYSDPQLIGQVRYHAGSACSSEQIGYDLTAHQWKLTTTTTDWQQQARLRLLHLQGVQQNCPEQSARTFGCERVTAKKRRTIN
jgi:hypothetical protein